jgi:capsular polysaccharide biosynthesis protein
MCYQTGQVNSLSTSAAAQASREPNHELTFPPDQSLGADHALLPTRIGIAIPHTAMSEHSELFPEDLLTRAQRGETWWQYVVKRELNQRFAPEEGFPLFRQLMAYPRSAHLRSQPLSSVKEAAERRAAVFHPIEPAGERFALKSPPVIGYGNHRTLHGVSRSMYVAAFEQARLQGRSQLIRVGDAVLLDYEGTEFDSIDDELERDSAVFHHEGRLAFLIEDTATDPPLRIEECFSLLGPNSNAFGHWVVEYLPRLAGALLSGILPDVPVLIDANIARQHRESLSLLLTANARIIEISPGQVVEAGKLWYAPTYYYAPIQAKMNDRYSDDLVAAPPRRFVRLARFMRDRFRARIGEATGSGRIFLARLPSLPHRRLVNHSAIEAGAVRNGFSVIHMEDHDFAEQLRLIRNARFVTGPEGSAFFLAFFADRGARIAILNHTHTELLVGVTALLEALEMKTTIITGPFTREEPEFPHHGDYEIDESEYARFLERWLAEGAV